MPTGHRNTILSIMGRLIIQENGCCLWPDSKSGNGYGHVSYQGQHWMVHKLLYEHFVGAVPEGKELDHLCRTRACGNFTHVEPVTRRENALRGVGFVAVNARKTHCVHGHPYDETNTYWTKLGHRRCLECIRTVYAYVRVPEKPTRMELGVCIRGHALEGNNLIIQNNGSPRCRVCHNASMVLTARRRRARQKAG